MSSRGHLVISSSAIDDGWPASNTTSVGGVGGTINTASPNERVLETSTATRRAKMT